MSSLIQRLKQIYSWSSKVELQHDSEEQSSTANSLQELIKTTDAYRDCLIEFASEEQLILPINNLSEDDGDVKAIRAVVERVGKRGSDYQVQTPYPTLIFSIAARYLNKPILTYDEGFQVSISKINQFE